MGGRPSKDLKRDAAAEFAVGTATGSCNGCTTATHVGGPGVSELRNATSPGGLAAGTAEFPGTVTD
eukprot:2363410-Prorocentrum_lima.AAC.1